MKDKIFIGDTYEHQFEFQQSDVIKFAEASGDINPIHLDPNFASKSIFGRTIANQYTLTRLNDAPYKGAELCCRIIEISE